MQDGTRPGLAIKGLESRYYDLILNSSATFSFSSVKNSIYGSLSQSGAWTHYPHMVEPGHSSHGTSYRGSGRFQSPGAAWGGHWVDTTARYLGGLCTYRVKDKIIFKAQITHLIIYYSL